MMPAALALFILVVALGAGRGGARTDTSPAAPHILSVRAEAVPGLPRDARGRIARSASARRSFMARHPCPATGRPRGPCPGYVVDHIVPLKRGGVDHPSNMQWQTREDAKEKDRVE